MKKKISIAIPCYNEEFNIEVLYKKLLSLIKKDTMYEYEFIVVDNGSTDRTKEIIHKLSKNDKRLKGVILSRNFGPEASANACFV